MSEEEEEEAEDLRSKQWKKKTDKSKQRMIRKRQKGDCKEEE